MTNKKYRMLVFNKKFLGRVLLVALLALYFIQPSIAYPMSVTNEACPPEKPSACMNIQVKVFLEGPMAVPNSKTYRNTMRADLNTKRGILPGQTPVSTRVEATPPGHPFKQSPWNYSGEEGTDWTDADYRNIAKKHDAEVVDWVLVSLVEANGKGKKILSAAGVVLENGTVAFERDCFTQPSKSGAYFVLVEHRNHMGVMSPNPINVENGLLAFDFTRQEGYLDSPVNPTGVGQKEVLPGTFAMFACDGSQNMDARGYDISSRDVIGWSKENGRYDGYLASDFDMDGDVNAADKMLWYRNNGVSSRVPR